MPNRFTDRLTYCGTRTNGQENQHRVVYGYLEFQRENGNITGGRFCDSQDQAPKTVRSGKITKKSIEFIAESECGWAIKIKTIKRDKEYQGKFQLPKYDGKITFQIYDNVKDITQVPEYN